MSDLKSINNLNSALKSPYLSFSENSQSSEVQTKIPSQTPVSHVFFKIVLAKDSLSSLIEGPDRMPQILELNIEIYQLDAEKAADLTQQISQGRVEYSLLIKKENTQKQAKAIKVKALGIWQAAQDLGSYGAYATSAVIGIGFCTSPILAPALIASGTIGFAAKLISDTGGSKKIASYLTPDEKLQQKYTSNIENVSMITGIGCSLLSVGAGAFNAPGAFQSIASATIVVVNSSTSAGSNFVKSSVLDAEKDLKKTELEERKLFDNVNLQITHMSRIARFQNIVQSILSSMLSQHFIT